MGCCCCKPKRRKSKTRTGGCGGGCSPCCKKGGPCGKGKCGGCPGACSSGKGGRGTQHRGLRFGKRHGREGPPDDYLGHCYYEGALIDVGNWKTYFDLPVGKGNYQPGWHRDRWGRLSYCILLERDLGMELLEKIRQFPTTARLPEPCKGSVYRSNYRGYEVVGIKLVNDKDEKTVLDNCVRKLKAAGPPEFNALMAYYGTDPARRTVYKKKKLQEKPPRNRSLAEVST